MTGPEITAAAAATSVGCWDVLVPVHCRGDFGFAAKVVDHCMIATAAAL